MNIFRLSCLPHVEAKHSGDCGEGMAHVEACFAFLSSTSDGSAVPNQRYKHENGVALITMIFLESIKAWRDVLSSDLSNCNPRL